jgi:hypothetical protein
MKVITFTVPESKTVDDPKHPFTRILAMMWLNYLISQGEVDIAPEKRRTSEYRMSEEQVFLFGQLMGELGKSEGKVPN